MVHPSPLRSLAGTRAVLRPWFALALLIALAVVAHAAPAPPAAPEARKALVVEGDDHLFMVSAPKGWVLDDTSGMGSRIRCVFYPKGQRWATAPTVMYVNPLHGFAARERKFSTLISDDIRAFLKRAPKGRVVDGGTLPTTTPGKEAVVRYFSEDGGPPREAVAYVPEKKLVMLIVLSSQTAQGFQDALPAYRDLVSTYAWVGTNREFGR
jgi:hypothetical protein